MLKIPIFGKMWVMFFASYGELFNHRGLSHWYVFGTLTRLFWIVRLPLVGVALLWLLQLSGVIEVVVLIDPEPLAWDWFLPFMAGWVLQDFFHITADLLVSDIKQKKKRKGKR